MPKITQKLHFKCNTVTLQQPKAQPGQLEISTAPTLVFSHRQSADSPLRVCTYIQRLRNSLWDYVALGSQ